MLPCKREAPSVLQSTVCVDVGVLHCQCKQTNTLAYQCDVCARIQTNTNTTNQTTPTTPRSRTGNFSAPKSHELAIVRGSKILELLRPDDNGKMQTMASVEVFGVIRSLVPFRLPGNSPTANTHALHP